jgi:hypothetical protein
LGRFSLSHKPPRLLSGTSTLLLDSLDDTMENTVVKPPPGG